MKTLEELEFDCEDNEGRFERPWQWVLWQELTYEVHSED